MPGKKKERMIWRKLFKELKMLCWMQTVAGEKISLCAVFCLYEKEHLEKIFNYNEKGKKIIFETYNYEN